MAQNINTYGGDANLGFGGGMGGVAPGTGDFGKTIGAFEKLQLLNAQKNKELYAQQQKAFDDLREAIANDKFDLTGIDPKDQETLLKETEDFLKWRGQHPESYNGLNITEYGEGQKRYAKLDYMIGNSKKNYPLIQALEKQKESTPWFESQIDNHIKGIYDTDLANRKAPPYVPAIEFNDKSLDSYVPGEEENTTDISSGDFNIKTTVKEIPLEKLSSNFDNFGLTADAKTVAEAQALYQSYLKSPQSFVDDVQKYNEIIKDYNGRKKTNIEILDPTIQLDPIDLMKVMKTNQRYKKEVAEDKDYTHRSLDYQKEANDQAKEKPEFGYLVDDALALYDPNSRLFKDESGRPINVVDKRGKIIGKSSDAFKDYLVFTGKKTADGTPIQSHVVNIYNIDGKLYASTTSAKSAGTGFSAKEDLIPIDNAYTQLIAPFIDQKFGNSASTSKEQQNTVDYARKVDTNNILGLSEAGGGNPQKANKILSLSELKATTDFGKMTDDEIIDWYKNNTEFEVIK